VSLIFDIDNTLQHTYVTLQGNCESEVIVKVKGLTFAGAFLRYHPAPALPGLRDWDLGDDSLSVFDLCSESIWSLSVVAA